MGIMAYIRVSTKGQNFEGQSHELQRYARDNSFVFDEVVKEVCSGAKSFRERELGKLLNRLQEGDTLIACEISRLGRRVFNVLEILNLCLKKKIELKTLRDHYTLSADPHNQILGAIYAYIAEMERVLQSQRIKEGIEARRAKGLALGRPFESKPRALKLDPDRDLIRQLIEKRTPLQLIAQLVGVDRQTLRFFLRKRFERDWLAKFNIVWKMPDEHKIIWKKPDGSDR